MDELIRNSDGVYETASVEEVEDHDILRRMKFKQIHFHNFVLEGNKSERNHRDGSSFFHIYQFITPLRCYLSSIPKFAGKIVFLQP